MGSALVTSNPQISMAKTTEIYFLLMVHGALFIIVSLGPKPMEAPSQLALRPTETNVVQCTLAYKPSALRRHPFCSRLTGQSKLHSHTELQRGWGSAFPLEGIKTRIVVNKPNDYHA